VEHGDNYCVSGQARTSASLTWKNVWMIPAREMDQVCRSSQVASMFGTGSRTPSGLVVVAPRRLGPPAMPVPYFLRPVVEAFMLLMLDVGHDLTLGRGVAAQLVGISTRGARPRFFRSLRNKRLAAFLTRRLCTRTSRT
jgi:hypothetical protein